jgi:hypothetical protein
MGKIYNSAWCGAYKTFQKLFEKAAENISATLEK